MTRALVLGGGGIAGIAWHTGILQGLAESGVDATSADLYVGTSAGATVAAQLAGGVAIDELFRRQMDPETLRTERTPAVSIADLIAKLAPIYTEAIDDADRRRRLGAMALTADTVEESVRREVIVARLRDLDWPDQRLAIVVVEALTGHRVVFDDRSGVTLVDAVAASSAVPGVWPPSDHLWHPLRRWWDLVAHQYRPGRWPRPGPGPGPAD